MINPYLAGQNQYGGSSAANKGLTLNPTGYLQRESNKRSQLAQNFMTQNQQGVGGTTVPLNNFDQRTATGRIIPPSTTEFQNPPAPNIQAPTGMPADSQYNNEAFGASTDYQNQARSMLEQRQMAELDYANKTRGMQQVLDKLPGQLRSQAAKRGLLRSSFFGQNLEEQMSGVGNQVESALADRNFADKAYTSGLTDLSGNYSGLMALAAQNLAARNAENAGKLGLGTPDNTPFDETEIGKKINEIINQPRTTPDVNQNPAITPPATGQPAAGGGGNAAVPAGGTYASGARGDAVKQIQSIVGVNPDGVFGPKTQAAVKAWQQQHGLVADGVVGPKTLAAMRG